MKVTITIYGGAGEIGANKILVEDEGHDVKFFLDFGKSFETMREYYDFPISPRSLKELIETGATPDLPNLYHDPDAKKLHPSDIDAVFLSHAHTDHSGYIPLLNRSIPIYMGECTQRIYEARLEGMRKSFDTDTEGQIIKPFRSGDTVRVGNVEIKPYHVDHSIPAAYGFLVHCSECSLVYSGDFRRHGTRPDLTQDFIDAVQQSGQPDVMLCEGTNIAKAELATEDEVHQKTTTILGNCKSLAIADFSETDFDRFRTMQSAAQANDRELVLEPRRMWVLHALNQCRELDTPSIAHDLSFHWFDAEKKRTSKYEKLLQEAYPPINELADRAVTAKDLHKTPHRYVVSTSFGSISTIQRIKPPKSGIYLLSASEPFNEESEISFDKLLNWLALQGLAMYTVHCSGHVHPIHLFQTIEEMAPKQLIPIHTEHPELFKRFIHASGVRVNVPKPAFPITLS